MLALQPPRLGDVPKRLAAVRAFAALPEAPALAAANKPSRSRTQQPVPGPGRRRRRRPTAAATRCNPKAWRWAISPAPRNPIRRCHPSSWPFVDAIGPRPTGDHPGRPAPAARSELAGSCWPYHHATGSCGPGPGGSRMGQVIAGVRVEPLEPHDDHRGSFPRRSSPRTGPRASPPRSGASCGPTRGAPRMHLHLRHDDFLTVLSGTLWVGLHDLRPGSSTAGVGQLIRLSDDAPSYLACSTRTGARLDRRDGGHPPAGGVRVLRRLRGGRQPGLPVG